MPAASNRQSAFRRFGNIAEQAAALALPILVAMASVFLVEHVVFLKAADWFIKDTEIATLTAPAPQDPDIVVAKIDEDTLRLFTYREPVDRKFLSDLIERLLSFHPRAIGLDVLFDQPTEKAKDDALYRTLHGVDIPMAVTISGVSDLADEQQFAFEDRFVPPRMRALPTLASDQSNTVRWVFSGSNVGNYGRVRGLAQVLANDLGIATPHLDRPNCNSRCLEIVWHGHPGPETGAFRTIPAQDLLDPRFQSLGALIRDKIVLIGSIVTLNDLHRTPFAALDSRRGIMPGVVIHAHALAQLLHHTSPRLAGLAGDLLVALLFAFGGAALGAWSRALSLRASVGVFLLVVLWAAGLLLFRYSVVSIGLLAPTIASLGSFGVADALAGGKARRQREFIHNAFSHYVSPKVVERLLRDPNLSLEGDRRVMTFLFTDVESFTTFSETIESKELARILNSYFDGVTKCVLKHDGMIDKFIGDSVMAIFNAPIDLKDHALCAVRCAIEIDGFAKGFSRSLRARGMEFGVTRIGVHTGPAVVGNFGSSTRFSYTAAGDSVNLASRLEGLNKYFHTHIAVSEATVQLCPQLVFRPIGEILVKGKTAPIEVFEPIDSAVAQSPFIRRYRAAYEGLKANDPAVESELAALAAEEPSDALVALHLSRLRAGEKSVSIVMPEK